MWNIKAYSHMTPERLRELQGLQKLPELPYHWLFLPIL